jgi:hypothetical protein
MDDGHLVFNECKKTKHGRDYIGTSVNVSETGKPCLDWATQTLDPDPRLKVDQHVRSKIELYTNMSVRSDPEKNRCLDIIVRPRFWHEALMHPMRKRLRIGWSTEKKHLAVRLTSDKVLVQYIFVIRGYPLFRVVAVRYKTLLSPLSELLAMGWDDLVIEGTIVLWAAQVNRC